MENLLEKIIKEAKSEELGRLDALNIVNSIFSELLERERDVLTRRFGLKGDKSETLEKIGSLHKLTRERVRQIEAASIRKIKKLESLEGDISSLKQAVYKLLEEHGGLIKRDYLLDILTVISLELNTAKSGLADDEKTRQSYKNHFNFLISKLMSDDLELVNNNDKFTSSFKLKNSEVPHLEELSDDLIKKVGDLNKTLTTEEVLDVLKKLETYSKNQETFAKTDGLDIESVFKSQTFPDKGELINGNKILYSLMQSTKNLEQNKYGDWGISDWQEIKPKTVNDKIYLVLKHEGKPLHFTDIAGKINDVKFDKKKANAATVHNELILDDRYVLISRGTYGLKEWQK
ncbi:MAG: sigma factor-like helix-turn-helix DNA-binding protein [Patescibacteria group bacterium]|jgi:hypothetical protein